MQNQNTDCLEAEVDQDPQAVVTAQDRTAPDPHIELHIRQLHIERPTTGHRLTDPVTIIQDTDLQLSWSPTLDFMPIQPPIGASITTEEDGEQVVLPASIAEVDAALVKSCHHTPILTQPQALSV